MGELRAAAIVPVFERPSVVLDALESVARQTRPPARLIVVDDGSSDATADRVEEWIAGATLAFPAELVRQAHEGVSVARNRGAELAAGVDLFAFLDSDDLWAENYLEEMVAALEPRPDAIAASCNKRGVDAASGRERITRRGWVQSAATLGMVQHGPAGISNSVLRASAFFAEGGFVPALQTAEDLDLMLRLSLRGAWLHVASTTVTYRHRYAEMRGEAPALAHWHADRRRTRAEVLEQFLARDDVREAVPTDVGRRMLGQLWSKAGRQLRAVGRRAEADDCFRHALRARPLDVRSRLRLWW